MNPVVFLFADGTVLFIGAGLAAVTALLLVSDRMSAHRIVAVPARILLLTGGTLAALSGTPFPVWLWVVAGVAFFGAAVALLLPRSPHRKTAAGAVVCLALGLSALEVPWHLLRPLPFPPGRPIAVIGDSISAGTEDGVRTWPEELSILSGRRVENLAVCGNTLRGALSSVDRLAGIPDACVIFEIGGNDMLRGDSSAEFDRHLRQLLEKTARLHRPAAMFELPIPPFRIGIGRSQRRLAAEFGVHLIPKRVLSSVLATPGATLDGIHLSAKGHRLLAERIAALLPR